MKIIKSGITKLDPLQDIKYLNENSNLEFDVKSRLTP